nr:hypothetical protein BdHM001_32170 [Bdellovibrio sp. HM001]
MKSVLVIEDFLDTKDIITNWIEKTLKGQANSAITVKAAINLLDKNSFDLIICDYELPDGNAEKILAHLRQNKVQTPTILFTARHDLSMDMVSPVVHIIKDKDFFKLFDFIEALP